MAGRIKHMERSHRSVAHKHNEGIYNSFGRKAYSVSLVKQQRRETFGQSLVNALKRAAGIAKVGKES